MNTDKIYAEQIANEYAPKKASKVVALRKLDQKVKRPVEIFAFTLGSVSSLILGTGMSLCLGAIGGGTLTSMIIGLVVGIVGLVGCGINYPIYKKMLETNKQKYGSEIIRLAKEIAEEE